MLFLECRLLTVGLYLHDSDYNSQLWPKTFVWFLFYKLRPHPSELTKLQFFVKISTTLHNLLVRFPMLISKQSFTQSRELFFVQNSIPANENQASCLQCLTVFSYPSLSKVLKQSSMIVSDVGVKYFYLLLCWLSRFKWLTAAWFWPQSLDPNFTKCPPTPTVRSYKLRIVIKQRQQLAGMNSISNTEFSEAVIGTVSHEIWLIHFIRTAMITKSALKAMITHGSLEAPCLLLPWYVDLSMKILKPWRKFLSRIILCFQ